MVWVGFVDLWGFKCTFCHDFEGPAIQCCNFCSFMIFICIWLCFCNPNSKSMAWRKHLSPWSLTPASWLLLIDLWPNTFDPWPLNHEQSTLSSEPWALPMVHELLALTKMMQSCPNRQAHGQAIDFQYKNRTETATSTKLLCKLTSTEILLRK